MSKPSDSELLNKFRHHPPGPERAAAHNVVRGVCGHLATTLDELLPPGPEREQAMLRLREVMFWSNAAVALIP